MDSLKLGLLAALLLAAPMATPAGAQAQLPNAQAAPDRIVTRSGDAPELGGRSTEMGFVTGGRPRITAQVADDIFVSGGELSVEGASADHLFLAGGEIDAAPTAVRDLIAAGGHIVLRSGAVSDDVVATGGEISLGPNARIGGSAVLAGGRLSIAAPVGGELIATGGRIELNGPVAGNARIRGGNIVVGPQARIGGDLHVRGRRIEIAPGAVVQGRTVREVVQRDGSMVARFALLGTVFALGMLVMLGAIAAAAPRLMDGVSQRLQSRLGVTVGIGALIVLLGPVLIVTLLATVLGAPLGLVLALAYLLGMPLAFAGVSYWIGQLIRARLGRARSAEPPQAPARFGWTAAAGLLLMIACLIPIIGGLIWLLVLATGMGALASQLAPRRPEPAPVPA